MKSLKMKYTFAILALFLSLQIHAQIPDSLGVELPFDVIRFSSCDDTMGEGPKSDVSQVFIQLKSDVITEDALGDCLVRTKTWDIFDWAGDESYTYSQSGLINFPEPLMCEENVYLSYTQLPFTLNKDNLLLNEDENHQYSFSYSDINDVERIIELGGESNLELYMYDHTAKRVCKSNVYITECEDDIVINVPETAAIVFDGEPYIELTPEMLGAEIEYPCETYTTKIRVGNQSNGVLSAQNVGKIVTVKLEIKIDNGVKYTNYIDVSVSGIKPDPLPMYIEDKSFVAGELIALEIWSEGITGLAAWQLQLEFQDAEVLALEDSELFDDIPENIFNDGTTVRGLWFTQSGFPIDVETDATWFTLIIKPEIDGSTLDLFKTQLDPWSLIALEDENYIHAIDAEFIFNVAPRDLLGIDDNINYTDIKVFPNPSSNKVSISGLPNADLPTKINVYDMEGKLMLTESVLNNKIETTIDISDLPSGLFILKAQNGNVFATQKISKI